MKRLWGWLYEQSMVLSDLLGTLGMYFWEKYRGCDGKAQRLLTFEEMQVFQESWSKRISEELEQPIFGKRFASRSFDDVSD